MVTQYVGGRLLEIGMSAVTDDRGRPGIKDPHDARDRELQRTTSEQECDLMIEALRRELHVIRVRPSYGGEPWRAQTVLRSFSDSAYIAVVSGSAQ